MNEDWKKQLAKATGYEKPLNKQSKGGEQKLQIEFYSNDGQKIIHKDLLDGTAKKIASSFVHNRLNSTQLRKFHNDIRDLEAKVEANSREFKTKMLPLVKMMKSKVAYACPTKGKKKVPFEFRRMMEACIDKIEEKRDFEVFSLFFEAVVGYFYGEGGQ